MILNLNKKTARGSQDDTKQTIKPSASALIIIIVEIRLQKNVIPPRYYGGPILDEKLTDGRDVIMHVVRPEGGFVL
ncbi:hypothetical protein NC651_033225 [Populus alba x Populus x berolinensis]|nr:hypothetical protein NC651_033225 [Populus alba x Populus x berolinensis]